MLSFPRAPCRHPPPRRPPTVQGYVKLADFGFAKAIGASPTFTICGTPDYQAPEIIKRKGTTKAADYWALGVLIFEMLVGDPPFKSISGDPWDTFRRTLSGRFYIPMFVSELAQDLIYKLLNVREGGEFGKASVEAGQQSRCFRRSNSLPTVYIVYDCSSKFI